MGQVVGAMEKCRKRRDWHHVVARLRSMTQVGLQAVDKTHTTSFPYVLNDGHRDRTVGSRSNMTRPNGTTTLAATIPNYELTPRYPDRTVNNKRW